MVQFCPKCGTQAPDDQSAFCNKCGTRLPPVIPEKMDIICPGCGKKASDEQSVFCNKCGSRLERVPPVQIQQAPARPAAASPPVIKKKNCPSCGAPLVDGISDYCNICGANVRSPAPLTSERETFQPSPEKWGPAPLTPARESYQSFPERIGPVIPVADIPDDQKDVPVQEKSRRPLLKWGLVAIVAVIFLVVAAAFIPGMISGTNQSATSPAADDQNPVTALPTQKTIKTTAPALTPAPVIVPTTRVPTTVVTTNTSVKVTTNISTTVTTKASANISANATPTATKTLSITNMSQPFSIGKSASDGKAKLTVNSVTFKDKLSDPVPSYAIGKKYLIVEITYENLQQNITAVPDISSMVVKDGGGYAFDQATDVLLENPFYVNGKSVPPQEKRTGNMLFIVPPGATYLKLQYNFGANIATFQLT